MNATKRLKRMKKKREENRRKNLKRQRNRQILTDLFSDLNLLGIAQESGLIDQILQDHPPAPAMRLASELNKDQVAQKLHKRLQTFMLHVRWTPPGLKRNYSVAAFFSLISPVIGFLTSPRKHLRNHAAAQRSITAFQNAKGLIEADTIGRFGGWMATEMRQLLVEHSRMDHFAYSVEIVSVPDDERYPGGWYLELRGTQIERRQLILHGETRWARRCAYPGHDMKLDWINWNSNQLGLESGCDLLPVYVFPHVFDRLCGPTGRLAPLDHSTVHDLLYLSLRNPTLHAIDGQPGCFLASYGHEVCKLGYLVCEVTSDFVVVKTFLFITMDGTPEGDALYQRLKVNRHDKSYLGLDNLKSLITSDIKDDLVIRAILRECKVDHIFEDLEYLGPTATGIAEEYRRYLRIKSPDRQPGSWSPASAQFEPGTVGKKAGAE